MGALEAIGLLWSPTTLVTVLCIVAGTIVYKLYNLIKFLKHFDGAPAPEFHWLWGHIFKHPGPNEKGLAYDVANTAKFGKYFVYYFGRWHPVIQAVHPDAARELLKRDTSKAHGMGGVYQMIMPWLGNSLLISTGDIWKRNRRLLTPAFHFDILKPYMVIKNESINYFIAKLKKESSTKGETVDIMKSCSLLALEVLMRCSLGYQGRIQDNETNYEFVECIETLGDELFRRVYSILLKFDFIYYYLTPSGWNNRRCLKYVHAFSENLIKERRAELKASKDKPKKRHVDFLDILILAKDEHDKGLTDKEIRQECDTVLFAGHDTTKTAMMWIIYNLAIHPEQQQKAYEEVAAIFADRPDHNVELEDLNNIPYLTLCVKESMRLSTTVYLTGRDLDEPLDIAGRTFPKGTQVFFHWYSYHHNPLIWGEDHMEFRPERFLNENMKDKDPYSYLPFAAGPRNCIGQNFALHEIKTIAMKMLLEFEMSADNKQHLKLRTDVVLAPFKGLYINLKPRQKLIST